MLLGLAYGLCLVSGLHAGRAAVRAAATAAPCSPAYYVLAYLGFAAPYGVDGLNAALGRPGAFALLAALAAVLAAAMRQRGEGAAPGTGAPQKRRIASNYEIPDPRADLLRHQRLLD